MASISLSDIEFVSLGGNSVGRSDSKKKFRTLVHLSRVIDSKDEKDLTIPEYKKEDYDAFIGSSFQLDESRSIASKYKGVINCLDNVALASMIAFSNYLDQKGNHRVLPKDLEAAKHYISIPLDVKISSAIEVALDYQALGGGPSGYAGALLRKSLPNYFVMPKRQVIVQVESTEVPANIEKQLGEVAALAKLHPHWEEMIKAISLNLLAMYAIEYRRLGRGFDHFDAGCWNELLKESNVDYELGALDKAVWIDCALAPMNDMILDSMVSGIMGYPTKSAYLDKNKVLKISLYPSRGFLNCVLKRSLLYPVDLELFHYIVPAATLYHHLSKRDELDEKLFKDRKEHMDDLTAMIVAVERDTVSIASRGFCRHMYEMGKIPKAVNLCFALLKMAPIPELKPCKIYTVWLGNNEEEIDHLINSMKKYLGKSLLNKGDFEATS